jgi:hypothetical protein
MKTKMSRSARHLQGFAATDEAALEFLGVSAEQVESVPRFEYFSLFCRRRGGRNTNRKVNGKRLNETLERPQACVCCTTRREPQTRANFGMKDFARDATHTGPIEQAELLPRLICDGTPIGGNDSRVTPGRR